MSKMDDNMADIFDIEPKKNILPMVVEVEPEDPSNDEAMEDFKKVRTNLFVLIENGKTALEEVLAIAKDTENPRAFEVFGTLMKQLSEINDQILDTHTKKVKMRPAPAKTNEAGQVTNNTQNIVFTGSTAELSKMIKDISKGN